MAQPGERRARLRAARLYLVIEAAPARDARLVESALAGGVDVIQLREKHAPDQEVVEAGLELREMCTAAGALLVVNDRADLALECGADGVHVGQHDEPFAAVRRAVGPGVLIGLSTHSPAQVDAAEASGEVDYLGVGPVYETATKPGLEPVGIELVRYAAANALKPWFAIGGIEPGRAAEVAAAGAERVAVVRAIRDARDPRAAAEALREAMERVPAGGQAQ
ncbi:MAG: thiamine-phosphate pyrophosphorylase [Thermoleophilaceae bacterium]|jgi:thiamine-phosphate pyrophosphorylase|nr:thiamine-phosphate pyrophosphorylase [Thermoleophilaceae bacterium]